MTSLHPAAPACNAASPPPVGPDPGEFLVGAFTPEKFDRWLSLLPGRRDDYESYTPRRQAEVRARVARLFALRSSRMPADLAAAADLARRLRELLVNIVATYRPGEARAVLERFGLSVPTEADDCTAWGGLAFAPSRRACRRLALVLAGFAEEIGREIGLPLVPPAGENGGAK